MVVIAGKEFVIYIDWDDNDGCASFEYKDQMVSMCSMETNADEEVMECTIPLPASLLQPI